MRVLLVAAVLTYGVLGLSPLEATADPAGPFCLERGPMGDVLELFILPSGGPNFLISGRIGQAASGVPLSGSGYITGNSFRFSLSGQAPSAAARLFVADGVFNLTTNTGTGECYTIGTSGGCGNGTAVTYTVVACPLP